MPTLMPKKSMITLRPHTFDRKYIYHLMLYIF